MIHHFFLIDHKDDIILQKEFWTVDFDKKVVFGFAQEVRNAEKIVSMQVDHLKFVGKPLLLGKHKGAIIICAEALDDDVLLHKKVDYVASKYRRVLEKEIKPGTFMRHLSRFVTVPLYITVTGYGGVGKDEILTILNGGTSPSSLFPMNALEIDKIEGPCMGTYEVIGLDIPAHNRFRKLGELYFKKSRIIILVTDSTLENVLNSKDIIDLIRRNDISVPVIAIANKQDLPGALSPQLVQRIFGIPAYGMVPGVEKEDKVLDTLWDILYQEVPEENRSPRPPLKGTARKVPKPKIQKTITQKVEKRRERKPLVKIVDYIETEEYHLSIRNKIVNEALLEEVQHWAKEHGYFVLLDKVNSLGFLGPRGGPLGHIICSKRKFSSKSKPKSNYIVFRWRTAFRDISITIRVFGKKMVDNSIILAERVEHNIPSKLPQDLELKEVQVIKH